MTVRYNSDTLVLQSVNTMAIFVVLAVDFRVHSLNTDCLGIFHRQAIYPHS